MLWTGYQSGLQVFGSTRTDVSVMKSLAAPSIPGSTVQTDPDSPTLGLTLDWWLYCTAAQGQEREQHFTSGVTVVLDKLD